MATTTSRLARVLRAAAIIAAAVAGAASAGAQVLSPGAQYDDRQPRITRVSAYSFIDMRPEIVPDAFRSAFSRKLADELTRSGVASQLVWFSQTQAGRDLIADPKAYTAVHLTTIPIGKTIRENLQQDRAFKPSHWLLIYPTETEPSGDGAILTVRLEFKDTRTGYINWSIFGTLHQLSRTMGDATAEKAAADFVQGIVAEMRRCKVLADAPT